MSLHQGYPIPSIWGRSEVKRNIGNLHPSSSMVTRRRFSAEELIRRSGLDEAGVPLYTLVRRGVHERQMSAPKMAGVHCFKADETTASRDV